MRLRYTGSTPVTFMTEVGEVEPGDEFTVPDEAAPGYLARADVIEAAPSALPVRRKGTKADSAPLSTEEASDAVPDVR